MELKAKGKTVLAIGAHPDDIEFACGATMAKLSSSGAELYFVVCTDGNRGSRHHQIQNSELVKSRQKEQFEAAQILGAKEVIMLNHEDGNLTPDIAFKEEIVKLIRKFKPDMVFTHDPNWFYKVTKTGAHINHNDHRATGIAVLDAVYPLSRDLASFPDHAKQGLTPHIVPEVYLFNFDKGSFYVDVTDHFPKKAQSINAHKSQIDHPEKTILWVEKHLKNLGKRTKFKYAEAFTKLKLS